MRGARSLLLSGTMLGGWAVGSICAQSTWRTDSLMATWPVQQRMREIGPSMGRGVVKAVDTDHLYKDLQREAPGIPVFADSNVVFYADLYGEPLREQFRVLLGVSAVYFPMIEKELALQGLPKDLKCLPMALSAMNVQAGSSNGCAGLWMLSYPVALRYGLSVTADVDERHNDVKSTMVAGRYLKDLHARYKDWGLAIMAFACGPANVTRAQQRTGGATDYRTLIPHFTDGQREILPLLMAFTHLTANATALGLEPIVVMPWETTDTLSVPKELHLQAIAQVMQLPLGRLKALNPMLSSGHIPANQAFQLPNGMRSRFEQLTDSVQHMEEALSRVSLATPAAVADRPVSVEVQKTIRYRVRAGDNLGRIAEKHHVTIRQLKTWNNLRSDRINAGKMLLIHVKKRELVKPSTEPEQQLPEDEGPTNSIVQGSSTVDMPHTTIPSAVGSTSYIVQSGDSLYRIAQRYPGVTAQLIMEVNGIGTSIKPGQELKIPNP